MVQASNATLNALQWPQLVAYLAQQRLLFSIPLSAETLFFDSHAEAQQSIQQVMSLSTLLRLNGLPDVAMVSDITLSLKRLAKQAELHNTNELLELFNAFNNWKNLLDWLKRHADAELKTALQGLNTTYYPILLQAYEATSTLTSGNPHQPIESSASSTYAELIQQVQHFKAALTQQLQQLLSKTTLQPLLADTIITERDGHYLIAIRPEGKNKVDGVVWDTSASGQTVYIEPQVIQPLVAKLRKAEADCQIEIRRLLHQLSLKLQPLAQDLLSVQAEVQLWDLLLAKAQLATALDCDMVTLRPTSNEGLALTQARHPLLQLAGVDTVANTVVLPAQKNIMVISGANAGGKTVVLKLVGLLSLMAAAGMPLPITPLAQADVLNTLPYFNLIFADIGDSQSLEQNLSTFSAHLGQLAQLLAEPDLTGALVLIDEIGAGTDPVEAGCLAEAVLTELAARGATVIVTTHLNALKKLAYQHAQFENASVMFDEQTFKPLYKLVQGTSGQSHALAIAKSMGIAAHIIDHAQENIHQRQSSADELIEQLEIKQAELNHKELETEQRLAKLKKDQLDLQDQYNRLVGEKRQLLDKYKAELKNKFSPIESQLERLKTTIKQRKQLSPSNARFYTKQLNTMKSDSTEALQTETQSLYPQYVIEWEKIQLGDLITSKATGLKGQVVSKDDKRHAVQIQSGALKSTIKWADIAACHAPTGHEKSKSPKVAKPVEKLSGPVLLLRECDVRGHLLEEAQLVVETFLDEALLDNLTAVGIIHGIGTGSLKRGLRQFLGTLPYVKRFYPAQAIEGGDGKTIVELN